MLGKLLSKIRNLFVSDLPSTQISQKKYFEDFGLTTEGGVNSTAESSASIAIGKREKALNHALDIRKFEIELYWKRATYFWTFIGATFAGYGAVQTLKDDTSRGDLSVFLSCLGIVFSFGWVCANKGSKQWQENWENHVDMLEDRVIGPLYKTVLRRRQPVLVREKFEHFVTGPAPFSVSKINLIISSYVTVLWVLLLWRALPPFSRHASPNWMYVLVIASSFLACVLFQSMGRTHTGSHRHRAFQRHSEIVEPDEPEGV